MPFPPQNPQPFSRESIEAITLGQMGCYGLFRQGLWVYIGKGDIRSRLLDHLNGDNYCINLHQPTHWVAAVTADYDNLEKQLILELNPACNKRAG